MKQKYRTPTTLALASLTLAACITQPVGDNILFSAAPAGDWFEAAFVEEVRAAQAELSGLTEADIAADESLKEKQDIVELLGPSRGHEGDVGLFWGHALEHPTDINFTFNANRQNAESGWKEEDFIPSHHEWRDLAAPYGSLKTLLIEADSQRPDPSRPLFIHCYGNGASLYNIGTTVAIGLLPFGDILQFEYPGFGETDREQRDRLKKASNFRPMVDTLAADLNAQNITRPLIFWGHSLGGLVCADLAAKVQGADGLILETTGNDAKGIASAVVPTYARPFVRLKIDDGLNQYSIAGSLEGFSVPILVLGAKRDKTLSVKLARDFYAGLIADRLDADYVEFPEANHLSVKTDPALPATLEAFLAQLQP